MFHSLYMPKQKIQKITPLLFGTYLAVIKNSVGSKMFKNFYAMVDGKKKDIMRDGDLSCGFFVSSVLFLFKLIKSGHGTIHSTIEDLKKSGWKTIPKPKIGSILVWETIVFKNGENNKHIGFYVGKDTAISTNSTTGRVYAHHFTFNDKRRIEAVFWNSKLDCVKEI